MLTASFSCFQGLSSAAEQKIWRIGCLDWQAFTFLPQRIFSAHKHQNVLEQMKFAIAAREARSADFFLNRFSYPDKIRVLHDFHAETAFLDIETSGLSRTAKITTIACLLNGHLRVFTQGIDLHLLFPWLAQAKMLVTYNGARFDLPIIRSRLGIDLAIPHLDLMPVLAAFGFKGGQKRCEQLAQLNRNKSPGTTGEDAVRLWFEYSNNQNLNALRQLILYNAEDVVMLERLAVHAYNLAMSNYPLNVRLIPKIADEWSFDFV